MFCLGPEQNFFKMKDISIKFPNILESQEYYSWKYTYVLFLKSMIYTKKTSNTFYSFILATCGSLCCKIRRETLKKSLVICILNFLQDPLVKTSLSSMVLL